MVWVRQALGPFWGFLCGWWTWLYSIVDVAIYPTLFVGYLSRLIEVSGNQAAIADHPLLKWSLGLVLIVPMTWLNVRGAKPVGAASVLFTFLILAPFAAMIAIGLPFALGHPGLIVAPFAAPGKAVGEALGSGLFVVMWNYLAWDSMSTIAEEVDEPKRAFPKAIAIALPMVVLSYLIPAAIGAAWFRDPAKWTDGSWAAVAEAVGGRWLMVWVTLGDPPRFVSGSLRSRRPRHDAACHDAGSPSVWHALGRDPR